VLVEVALAAVVLAVAAAHRALGHAAARRRAGARGRLAVGGADARAAKAAGHLCAGVLGACGREEGARRRREHPLPRRSPMHHDIHLGSPSPSEHPEAHTTPMDVLPRVPVPRTRSRSSELTRGGRQDGAAVGSSPTPRHARKGARCPPGTPGRAPPSDIPPPHCCELPSQPLASANERNKGPSGTFCKS